MRYLIFIKHAEDYGGKQAPPGLYEAMGAFVEEQSKKGVFLDVAGARCGDP